MTDVDSVIEEIISRLNDSNLTGIAGIWAKRKRVREDAELTAKVRQAQRREIANWMRSFKSGEGNDALNFVRSVQAGSTNQYEWGPEVATALAARYVTMTVSIELSTHLPNCHPKFSFAVTDKGLAAIGSVNQGAESRSAPTASPGAVSDATC